MNRPITLILTLCCLSESVVAQENATSPNEDSGYYRFLGAEILAPYRSKPRPVVSADKKGIYVEYGKSVKRVTWEAPCMATPKTSVSNQLIKLENLSHHFFYRKNSRYEEQAYNDIRAKKRETELRIMQIGPVGAPGSNSAEAVRELEMERDEFVDETNLMIQNDELVVEGHADSILLSLTLTPPVDLQEAYCAVMASYRITDDPSKLGQQRVAVRVQRLGELLKDIPEDVSFSLYLGEGNYRNSQIELFLFSGDGSPLPSNLSRQLKMLTNAEYERMR